MVNFIIFCLAAFHSLSLFYKAYVDESNDLEKLKKVTVYGLVIGGHVLLVLILVTKYYFWFNLLNVLIY